jgi:hypothetical protein
MHDNRRCARRKVVWQLNISLQHPFDQSGRVSRIRYRCRYVIDPNRNPGEGLIRTRSQHAVNPGRINDASTDRKQDDIVPGAASFEDYFGILRPEGNRVHALPSAVDKATASSMITGGESRRKKRCR